MQQIKFRININGIKSFKLYESSKYSIVPSRYLIIGYDDHIAEVLLQLNNDNEPMLSTQKVYYLPYLLKNPVDIQCNEEFIVIPIAGINFFLNRAIYATQYVYIYLFFTISHSK